MDAINAIPRLSEGLAFERAQSTGPTLDALATRFADLLATQPPTHATPAVGAPTEIASFIDHQDKAYRSVRADLSNAAMEMPRMSLQQTTLRSIQLMNHVSDVQLVHNATLYFGQGVKNALQTLMKNQ
jgi:type III secretion system HrpB2-like protein